MLFTGMRRRYEAAVSLLPSIKLRPMAALRDAFREGYGFKDLRADLLAGVVVGIVALPLSMALAIATGVAPQYGLYTAIIAGGVIALLGGSRTQVSGPTAAFVVILVPIASKFGLGGLLLATMMAGVILVVMGAARMGRLIEFIPHPVTTGFTAGIAVVIATMQLKDFFGLIVTASPEHYMERVKVLWHARGTFHWPDLVIGASTLAILIAWPKVTKKIPGPLVALLVATIGALILTRLVAGFEVATIGSKFQYSVAGVEKAGIPQVPPLPLLPWHLPGPGGKPLVVSVGLLEDLFPSAFAIAMLGAIESLLSAVVADGMAGTKHDPDAELMAQGIGNIAAPFFGGFAATGAIARTATNIRAGARSPISAVVHAIFVLAAVLALAPLLAYLPMASLAALLILVAYNMSDVKHFARVLRMAPRSDVAVLLTCFTLTVVFDMVVSVTVGVVLAALLFMRRMAEITGAKLHSGTHPELKEPLPVGVVLYEINGPLFFGAAQKAMEALHTIEGKNDTVILDISAVPAIDGTGLVNLESAVERLEKDRVFVVISGIQPQPKAALARAGFEDEEGVMALVSTLDEAVTLAKNRAPRGPASVP
jgi:SulP family sulfate permease